MKIRSRMKYFDKKVQHPAHAVTFDIKDHIAAHEITVLYHIMFVSYIRVLFL